jgi:hypothetical protein
MMIQSYVSKGLKPPIRVAICFDAVALCANPDDDGLSPTFRGILLANVKSMSYVGI